MNFSFSGNPRLVDALVLSLIVLVFAGMMIQIAGDYGISRDEPDYFFVGERDFHFILTGNSSLLDHYYYDGKYDFEAKDHPFFRTRLFSHQPPPFAYILSAASCSIFYRWLGWLDPFQAHRLINKILMLILIVTLFYFTKGLWGRLAGYFSIAFLIFYPRLFGELFVNEKDVPTMAFFAWTVMSFWKGVVGKRPTWIVFSSLLCGFTLATKMNALFIPVVLVAWLFFGFGREGKGLALLGTGLAGVFGLLFLKGVFGLGRDWSFHLQRGVVTLGEMVDRQLYDFLGILKNRVFYSLLTLFASVSLIGFSLFRRSSSLATIKNTDKALLVSLWAYPFAAAATFLAAFPHLWGDPLHRTLAYLYYYASLSKTFAVVGPSAKTALKSWNGLYYFLVTTPVSFLFLSLFGVLALCRTRGKWERRAGWLIFLWFAVPILRASMAGMDNEGIRHFIEFVPPLSILAGVGMERFFTWGRDRLLDFTKGVKVVLLTGLIGLVYLPVLSSIVRLHPYEYVYFNSLVGGLKGAQHQTRTSYAGDYWGISYREGLLWLNRNAVSNAVLIVPIYGHLFKLYSLREDLRFMNFGQYKEKLRSVEGLSRLAKREPVYVMYVTRKEAYQEDDYLSEFFGHFERGTPCYTVVREGVPLLKIFRVGYESL